MKIQGKLLDSDLNYQEYPQEEIIGGVLAKTIGDTFINYQVDTPVVQWTKIVKILRLHGIKFSFD